ncbi:MAG: Bug family tripartite tricarboxylate transporter substrate binding protein [Candidatus Binatia bacterium]
MRLANGLRRMALLIVSLLVFPADAPAQEFYQGKTIRIIVGFAAGGGFDTYTRAIARHLGRHIPGNPSIVVENMTGAGSLIAANHIFNAAKPDGLTIGNWIGPLVLQQAIGNPAAKFDGRKFGYLGVPVADSGVCALTKASGITSPDEWLAAKKPVKLGGTAPGSTTDDVPRIVASVLGLPMQLISGFKGTSNIRLAADSGEIDGGCWAWESIKPTWQKGIAAGEVNIVIQTMAESHPELKHVPLAINYAKNDDARAMLEIVNGPYGQLARPYTVPPGLPKDRLELLQRAFMATMKDREFLAEAQKAKLDIKPLDGPAAARQFAALYTLKPGLKAKLEEIIIAKKK